MGTQKSTPAIDAAAKKAELKEALQGKTSEQKKLIKYFYGDGGCLSKALTDEEFSALVAAKFEKDALKNRALEKLGITEEQSDALPPVLFEGYVFEGDELLSRKGHDGVWRSTRYEAAWFFFGQDRVWAWRTGMDLVSGETDEAVTESGYKEVSNFSVINDAVEKEIVDKVTNTGKASFKRATVGATKFALIVSGEKFLCPMELTDETENAVRSMKLLLRDKRSSK